MIGTIVGALMIGLINTGLILMGLEFSQQLIARGGIIILAVTLSQKRGLTCTPCHICNRFSQLDRLLACPVDIRPLIMVSERAA